MASFAASNIRTCFIREVSAGSLGDSSIAILSSMVINMQAFFSLSDVFSWCWNIFVDIVRICFIYTLVNFTDHIACGQNIRFPILLDVLRVIHFRSSASLRDILYTECSYLIGRDASLFIDVALLLSCIIMRSLHGISPYVFVFYFHWYLFFHH